MKALTKISQAEQRVPEGLLAAARDVDEDDSGHRDIVNPSENEEEPE